jgi:hypothetical protein
MTSMISVNANQLTINRSGKRWVSPKPYPRNTSRPLTTLHSTISRATLLIVRRGAFIDRNGSGVKIWRDRSTATRTSAEKASESGCEKTTAQTMRAKAAAAGFDQYFNSAWNGGSIVPSRMLC